MLPSVENQSQLAPWGRDKIPRVRHSRWGRAGCIPPQGPSFKLHERSVTQGPEILVSCEDGESKLLVQGPSARANVCSCSELVGWG